MRSTPVEKLNTKQFI